MTKENMPTQNLSTGVSWSRSKVLGPENPETLKSRNNLALALNRQKKYVEAEEQFRELITVEERVLGPEHPETLRTRRNLLVTVGNQGRHAEAETGFRDLLAIEERVLGPEHPDTLGVRNNIGLALAQQMRFRRRGSAASRRNQDWKRRRISARSIPATLSSRMALAGVLSEQQNMVKPMLNAGKSLRSRRDVLGTDHPTTISSWHAFAHQPARQNKTGRSAAISPGKAATAAERSLEARDHPRHAQACATRAGASTHMLEHFPEAPAAEATKRRRRIHPAAGGTETHRREGDRGGEGRRRRWKNLPLFALDGCSWELPILGSPS